MLKIHMLPRYTAAAASSRLRVFHLAAAVNRLGLAECGFADVCNPDVVFMQKLDSSAIVRGHKRALYDVDDIWDGSILADAATAVQAFTVDTEGHGGQVKNWRLLPDMIDYEPEEPMNAAPAGPHLAWFGNYPNYASVSRLLGAAVEFCRPVTICDADVSSFPNFAWTYEGFPAMFRNAGTALLSHAGADPGKSANKLAAAVTLGVPCIVNQSPAYEAIARAVGLEWAIVNTPSELREAFTRLQDADERSRYLDAIQPYVWNLYRPETIARRFVEICEALA